MKIDLSLPSPRRVTQLLLTVVLSLMALSMVGQLSKHCWGHPRLKGFVPAFYVDYESTVPTWYSSAALAVAGALLALIAIVKCSGREAYRIHWSVLASIFVLLSIDEVAMFHEYPIAPLRTALNAGGLLYYTWVLPGMALVLLVGLAYWRFLQHLPQQTRRGFTAAAVVFVSGAIGVEMLSGLQADLYGEENLLYALIVTVEELLEMLGVVILIHALLQYIHTTMGGIRLSIGAPATQ